MCPRCVISAGKSCKPSGLAPDMLWESPNRKMLPHWNSRKTEWGEINQRGGVWNSMAQKLSQVSDMEPVKEKKMKRTATEKQICRRKTAT